MSSHHVVRQGESWTTIAHQYGFGDWRIIADHPDNAAIRRKRPHSALLLPGDRIRIPARSTSASKIATGKTHRFELNIRKRIVRLCIRDTGGRPLAGLEAQVSLDGAAPLSTRTDEAGYLEVEVLGRASAVSVEIANHHLELGIDGLDPINTITGVQQRLQGLGYASGRIDGRLGPKTRAALAAFQRDQAASGTELEALGAPDEETLKALLRAFDDDPSDAVGDLEFDVDDGDEPLPDGEPLAQAAPDGRGDDEGSDDAHVDDIDDIWRLLG